MQASIYFPLSTPVTALPRSAFGILSPGESAVVMVEQFGIEFLLLCPAVQLLRYGSI